MNNAIQQIKENQKKLAQELRLKKKLFKSKQRRQESLSPCLQELCLKKLEYRHRHIARCLLRGTPYNKIEAKVRPGNEPSEELIDKYKLEYLNKIQGSILNSATQKVIEDIVKQREIEEEILRGATC